MPRVSVLLTSYNKPAMLAEAIESVLAQTFQDFELLILEDNSPDPGVLDTLSRYWRRPQVTIYKSNVTAAERPSRVRYAVLANLGMAVAQGEYITYLCDDDLYYPPRLERMVAKLDEGEYEVVYGAQQIIRDGREAEVREARLVRDRGCPASFSVDHSSVMHTLAAGRAVGGWDDDPHHWPHADAIFWDRLTDAGYRFWPIHDVLDAHRYHPGSVSETLGRGEPL